jgi:hypothetical protein
MQDNLEKWGQIPKAGAIPIFFFYILLLNIDSTYLSLFLKQKTIIS